MTISCISQFKNPSNEKIEMALSSLGYALPTN